MSARSVESIDGQVAPLAESRRTEWVPRAFALLAYGFAVNNLAAVWWADRSRIPQLLPTDWFTLLLVLLVLLARPAQHRHTTWAAVLLHLSAAFSSKIVRGSQG